MAIKRLMAKKAINQASRQGKAIGKGAKEVAEKVAKESAEKVVKEGAESVAKAATSVADDGAESVKKLVDEARKGSPEDAINGARAAAEADAKKVVDDVKAEAIAEDVTSAGEGVSSAKTESKAKTEPKEVSERGRKYMKSKFNKSMKNVDDIYGDAAQLDDEALGRIQSQFRFGDDDMDALRAVSGDKEQMKTLIKSREDKYVQSYNMMDAAMAHKVPQMAAGAVGTSWLVQNMSNNRGRQSNAQLYNQR